MKGIVCRHMIKVLREVMQLKEIPEHYILKRWTRTARVDSVKDMTGRLIQADPNLQQASRYRSLCSTFIRILSKASESEKVYKLAMNFAEKLAKDIEDLLRSEMNAHVDGNVVNATQSTPTVLINANGNVVNASQSTPTVLINANGDVVNAKGLKKREACKGRKRIKSKLEISMNKKKKRTPSSSKVIEISPDTVASVADQYLEHDLSTSSLEFHAHSQEFDLNNISK